MPADLKLMTLAATGAALVASAAGAAPAERLVVEPYPAATPWKVVLDLNDPRGRARKFVPADQDPEAYRDLLTEADMPLTGEGTPAQFLVMLAKSNVERCEGLRVNGPVEKVEAGVPVAYLQVYCGREKAKEFGVNHFMKAMRTPTRIYYVDREFRVPPSKVGGVQTFSDQAAAKAFMDAQGVASEHQTKSVYVCGGPSTDARCGKP